MAELSYGFGGTQVNLRVSNNFLATLQVATARRFHEGKGFFLTFAGTLDNGESVSRSHWIHPGLALQFGYDTIDDTGESVPAVLIDDEVVEDFLSFMDGPHGIATGYDPDNGCDLPFRTPAPASD